MSKNEGLIFEGFSPRTPLGAAAPAASLPDMSRYGNNGVFTNVVWAAQLSSGLWVLGYDGIDDVVTISDADSIANMFDGGGTIIAWVNPNTSGENNTGIVAHKGWDIWCSQEAASRLKVRFNIPWAGNDGEWRTTATQLPLLAWTFVVITYNADASGNTPLFYINGVSVAFDILTNPTGAARTTDVGIDLLFGDVAVSNRCFDGKQGKYRVANYALSADQINAIFAAERTLFGI